jgi:DNA-binding response OmpR family regulator
MKRRALVVDDDPTINAMIADILTLDRFEVTRVHDGDEAIGALRSDKYDVVLLDIMLPGQDGLSILKEIRAAADLSATPVVMLTAKADDDSAWEGWRAGCDSYMTKPFDPGELLATLHRLVSAPLGTNR